MRKRHANIAIPLSLTFGSTAEAIVTSITRLLGRSLERSTCSVNIIDDDCFADGSTALSNPSSGSGEEEHATEGSE